MDMGHADFTDHDKLVGAEGRAEGLGRGHLHLGNVEFFITVNNHVRCVNPDLIVGIRCIGR